MMASEAQEHVIRIPRSDESGGFVLLNVSSNGSEPLDLRLLATEGENPYATDIKQARISRFQDKKSQLKGPEWQEILTSILLQRPDLLKTLEPKHNENNEKIETIASISGSRLSIIFRKNISGITQRLGEIILTENQDIELDTVSWTSTAVQRCSALEQQVQDLNTKYESANQVIAKLSRQLEDLVVAKREHEDALLLKFRDLLNSKKLKIRDQQRLLASAKLDPKRAREVQTARASGKSRKPERSRSGKRKVREADDSEGEEKANSDEDEEDDFETMSSKQKGNASDEQVKTPEASEDSTEDETADEEDENAPSETGSQNKQSNGKYAASAAAEEMQIDSPPPERQLPFSNSSAKTKDDGGSVAEPKRAPVPPQEAINEDEEDEETTDEEL